MNRLEILEFLTHSLFNEWGEANGFVGSGELKGGKSSATMVQRQRKARVKAQKEGTALWKAVCTLPLRDDGVNLQAKRRHRNEKCKGTSKTPLKKHTA